MQLRAGKVSGNGHSQKTLISTMDTSSRITSYYKTIGVWIERLLALVILGGVLVFGLCSTQTMAAMDWRLTETFYELIYRVLLLVIGVELVRTLVTHELRAILELLAFVVARKMLKPDLVVLYRQRSVRMGALPVHRSLVWIQVVKYRATIKR